MDNGVFNRRNKIGLSLTILGAILVFNYSNCAPVAFKNATPDSSSGSPTGTQNLSGSIPVGATGSNPPLDLFFIVDNSASMYGNQVKLGSSFTNIFQSNQASLSNFNVNVYLFSTASTVATASLAQVATRSPASVTSVPAYSDLTDLLATPGSVFAYWNNSSGTYGTAPFSAQFSPAAVLESGNYSQALSLPQQGSQTASQYQASINALSTNFQNRLNYLNPSNQFVSGSDPASPVTDISSGLCSIARILKHSSGFIQPGDAAAFVIVSDDDDRLNDRNTNNNQCLENVTASNELINGSCGHYASTFNYDTTTAINYQSSSKFTYNSGTKIPYSYPSSETCVIKYSSGYNYTWTYTAIKTTVTYTKCTETADGFCVNSVPNSTLSVAGDYVGTGGTCLSTVNSLVPNAPGTNMTCASGNVPNTVGAAGVDTNSNGSSCSSQQLSLLEAEANVSNVSCTIGTAATSSKTLTGQSLTNPCSTACSGYSNCTATGSVVSASGSISVPGSIGLTCSNQCPSGESAVCGTGLISTYISGLQPGAACSGTPSNIVTTITIPTDVDSNESQLTCSSQCPAGDSAICGTGTISSYISGLQSGATCSVASVSASTKPISYNMSCTTPCASSGGFCAAPYTTVADFIAKTLNGYCIGQGSNGGSQPLAITFQPAYAQNASCASLCSNTSTGACGSNGFGATGSATAGSTVAQYITSLGGGVCTSSVAQVLSGSPISPLNSNQTALCTDPANPVFFASGAAYAGTATNYTAGDVNHTATEFQSAIVSLSSSIFGANPPAVALIGHLQGDVLPGASAGVTDVGTDYINLAQAMGSKEISSVTASDYSAALSSISSFIVQKSQNSFALGLPAGSTVFAVSVEHAGTQNWVPVASSLWTWTGSTLSVNPSAGLVQGDTLMYQYNE